MVILVSVVRTGEGDTSDHLIIDGAYPAAAGPDTKRESSTSFFYFRKLPYAGWGKPEEAGKEAAHQSRCLEHGPE